MKEYTLYIIVFNQKPSHECISGRQAENQAEFQILNLNWDSLE